VQDPPAPREAAGPNGRVVDPALRLAARFPALFGAGGPRPIKLRIQSDIQQRAPGAFTRKALSAFLHRHTTSTAYLKALVASGSRFDLDGEPAGEVAPEHREAAEAELARRRAVAQARRGAGRKPNAGPRLPAANAAGDDAAAVAARTSAAEPLPADQGRRCEPGDQARGGHRAKGAGRPERRAEAGKRHAGRHEAARDKPRATGPGPALAAGARPRAAAAGTAPPSAMPDGQASPDTGLPADEAQRARALLLRAWESSTLAKANFCALKRLSQAEFDAQMTQARAERESRDPRARAKMRAQGR
jgi:sRNA-binding protein